MKLRNGFLIVGSLMMAVLPACTGVSGPEEDLSPTGGIFTDGLEVDWESAGVLSNDPSGDATAEGSDLGTLRSYMDDQNLYIQVEILSAAKVEEFDISIYQSDERQYWIYYYPEIDTVEYSTPIGRRPVAAETFYGPTLELIIPLEIFEKQIESIGSVRAMTNSITAGDEVTGGLIPNQFGEVAVPTPDLLAEMDATKQAIGAKGEHLAGRDAESLSQHPGLVRIMTFNVFGGGVPPGGGDLEDGRIPDILEVIERVNPDIIAFQELSGWKNGNPTLAIQFADYLDMNLVYCINSDDEFSLDTAVLSNFKIVDSQTYPEIINCFIHAEVQLIGGQSMHVFANHVNQNRDLGCNKPVFEGMLEVSAGYTDSLAVLLGDFNINDVQGFSADAIPDVICYSMLMDARWNLVARTTIDNILVSDAMIDFAGYQLTPKDFEVLGFTEEDLIAVSDHRPVVWDVQIENE